MIFEKLQIAYQSNISQLQQKSRVKWDLEGDCNTRFFHHIIQQRRRRNQIHKIMGNNGEITEPLEIKRKLFQDFKDFFCKDEGHTPFLLHNLEWQSLSNEDSSMLTRQFTEEEIWFALQETDSHKSPGPDGFNAWWLKNLWPQISGKILSFFFEFYHRTYIPQGANSSFIALIPKKQSPLSMQDFRPISLINSSFKLLLKVLANRLKGVLGNLISEEQTAFVKGRNINESIFMVNEVIHAMKTQGIDGLILKIDFSKAYDTVDWSCLLHVMECVNMNQHWINWIKVILETTKMSILINGSPTEEFSPKRGIRQGDPLAPYLFLLIGEVLSRLIDRAVSTGACQGINFKFHNRTISHFQYADDTVLFIQNSKKDIRGMKRVLLLFQSITGLAINFNKSLVYHTSNDRDCLKAGIKILGCQPGSIPFKYLGDWVGLNVKPCSYWNSLVNQMQSKLQE